ncbi:putative reverse transcriptase domain-containing protein [Tanacetum coccineum]
MGAVTDINEDGLLADALGEASKVENVTAEMLRGLDQLMERKEDGVDRLTKSTHFLAIREDNKMEKLARLNIDEIVAGHGVHVSIISDHDGRFTSRVLENITESLRDAIGYESPVLWAEIGESRLIGPELVQETTNKVVLIKEKLKAAGDHQKSYADNRRKLLEFEVEDRVLLKVSPSKGVKYLADANLHVHLEEIKVDKTLHFVKEPVEIINREVKSLKRSRILIVKVH